MRQPIYLKFDLRSYSGQFDWLFTSMLIVLEGVSDEFSYFLDRSYYKVAASLSNQGGASEAYDYEYFKKILASSICSSSRPIALI